MDNDNLKKRDRMKLLESCVLCPRRCGVNRLEDRRGYCGMSSRILVARSALHMWEEPCLSGKEGSGTVFFSGCALRCSYCQNHEIAAGRYGHEVSAEQLSLMFMDLQDQGANNINLVTGEHYVPQIITALETAKDKGLSIPVVYNSSGYERTETLRMLEGLIDIYLPDFKYLDPDTAMKYSGAPDYPRVAAEALKEMCRQIDRCEFDNRGMMKRGVIVRHLLLPGHVKEARKIVDHLLEHYGSHIWISLMNQYTPMPAVRDDPLLGRKVTGREYQRLVEYALEKGLENGFIQEGETAKESFIPSFDGTGVNLK